MSGPILPVTCSATPPVLPAAPSPREREPEAFAPAGRSMWGHFVWCVHHFCDFSGRATRKEFWSFTVVYLAFLYTVPAALLPLADLLREMAGDSVAPVGAALAGSVLQAIAHAWVVLVLLGGILPNCAAACRRLHDAGLSGACMVVIFFPCMGLIVLWVLLLLDSRGGANRYGPATKYP